MKLLNTTFKIIIDGLQTSHGPISLCILKWIKTCVFTARSRKIHPFDDNNNHVSAAQFRKYPERKEYKEERQYEKREDEAQVIYYSSIYLKFKQIDTKNSAKAKPEKRNAAPTVQQYVFTKGFNSNFNKLVINRDTG